MSPIVPFLWRMQTTTCNSIRESIIKPFLWPRSTKISSWQLWQRRGVSSIGFDSNKTTRLIGNSSSIQWSSIKLINANLRLNVSVFFEICTKAMFQPFATRFWRFASAPATLSASIWQTGRIPTPTIASTSTRSSSPGCYPPRASTTSFTSSIKKTIFSIEWAAGSESGTRESGSGAPILMSNCPKSSTATFQYSLPLYTLDQTVH